MLQRKLKPSKYSISALQMRCQVELAGKTMTKQLVSELSHFLKLKFITNKVFLKQRVFSFQFLSLLLSSLPKKRNLIDISFVISGLLKSRQVTSLTDRMSRLCFFLQMGLASVGKQISKYENSLRENTSFFHIALLPR